MLRRCLRRLVVRRLPDGTTLDGTFHATIPDRLLSGIAHLPDGRCFKGTFDETSGAPLTGTQLEEDGDLYVGGFNHQWQRHGDGEAWLADGTHYKGSFNDDELVSGTVRIPSGVTEVLFEGSLKDEEFLHGTLKQHHFTYTGDFEKNRPHGKGVLRFTNGATQEGTFYQGALHGDNCTMKLEGGFVYVGSFVEGKIQRGMLYTAMYTYDGEFNEQGKAHGEGTQTHLAVSPKLTFTGIWHHGNLVRGVCVDEFGAPVDWQDRHDLQKKILEEEGERPGQLEVQKLCEAKLKEADSMFRDYQKSFVHDANIVQQESGTRPSKHDLGYEHSIREETSAVQREALRQDRVHNSAVTDGEVRRAASEKREDFEQAAEKHLVNVNMAKMKMVEQAGVQRLMSDRMHEQMERFKKEQEEAASTSDAKRGLRIDGNPTWKGFTAK